MCNPAFARVSAACSLLSAGAMKMNQLIIPLVTALAVAACGKSDGTPTAKTTEAKADKAPEEAPAYTNTAGQYTVRWPRGNPTESEKPDPKKPDIVWHDAKSPIGAYAVMYADFKDPAAAQKDVDDYIATMKSRTSATKDVTVSGHKAREIEMKISDTATMWVQLFTVGKRVYRVSAGTKNNFAQAHEFIDSFRLL